VKTILVIEDEPQTLRNISTILLMEGFRPLTAADGRLGLRLAEEHVPDLILCDVSMPAMDGYDVLIALRANARTACIPFLFLTARTDRKDVRTGMDLGADDYLYKPARVDELLGAVNSRLARCQERENAFRQNNGSKVDFASAAPLEQLGISPREAEVLLWIAQGKANSDIATILECSEKTVKIHVGHLLEKLGVENRTAAASKALEKLPRLQIER
jgi:DNA-binding NarL/FixJ family response regulator